MSRHATRALLLIFLVTFPAYAQFDTSSVLGTVRDSSGAAVPDAAVTVTNSETGVSQTKASDAYGAFEFVNLRAGIYVVSAEKSGFAVALADNVTVVVGTRQRVDMTIVLDPIRWTV